MKLFDSHCHLTDARLHPEAGAVIERARDAGVLRMVTIASDPDDAAAALALAQDHRGVWCTAGLHPHAAEGFLPGGATVARLRELVARPEVVALGETGLDFYYDNAPRGRQRAAFQAHLELAGELGLPIVVHSRDADDDTAALIRAHPGVRGVLHCFAGGAALLEAGLEAGWWVSFSGLVTFRSFEGRDLVREVPAQRLLVETDSPYLAPVPHRGKTNEPAFVRHVLEEVARLRGEDPGSVASACWDNANGFYGLPEEE